jgi:hypothetical protein
MKLLSVLACLLFIHSAIAQNPVKENSKSENSKTIVEIKSTENIALLDLNDEIWGNALGDDDGDSIVLVNQIGLKKYNLVNKKQRKEDLPLCVQQFLKDKKTDPFKNFTITLIAEYEHDLMIDSEWKCILEVSPKENAKLKGDCKIRKTFYIIIPQDDLEPFIHREIKMQSGGQMYI